MPDLLVATFYRFVRFDDPASLRDSVAAACERLDLRGTILLANEGINGTISGTRNSVLELLAILSRTPGLEDLAWKESSAERHPFGRMRVRIKKEIVTLGVDGVDPSKSAGTYVGPRDWNALISDPEVIVIDTRNDYEVEIGAFANAINPGIDAFGELTDWLREHYRPEDQPKVAMYCTGGIRCEKSTALLKDAGFEHVYHLEGGILKYLEEIPEEESLWNGSCFVFDDRVSVGHGLEVVPHRICAGCQYPLPDVGSPPPPNEPESACPRCASASG